MPRPKHPTYPTLSEDRVPDLPPAAPAAARRAVLAWRDRVEAPPEDVDELMAALGLVDERGRGAA